MVSSTHLPPPVMIGRTAVLALEPEPIQAPRHDPELHRKTGQVVVGVQRRVEHPVIRFLAATLDGMVEGTVAVFESKFMLPWSFSEEAAGPHAGAGIRRPSPNLCRVSLPEPRLWRPEPLKRRNLHFLVPIDGCSTRAAIDEASGFANPGTSGQSGSEAPAQP
jgi:hypothetical protein